MSSGIFAFSQRRSALAFWLGSAVVSAGVVLHLPMFWMGRHNGFVLATMPMDAGMLWGMALILMGILAAGYGLLPGRVAVSADVRPLLEQPAAPEDAPLTLTHWKLMGVSRSPSSST